MSPTNRIGILVVLFVGAVLIGVGVATLFNAQYAVEPIATSAIQTQIPTQIAAVAPSAPITLEPQATVQEAQALSTAAPTIAPATATSTVQVTEVPTTQPSPQSTALSPTQLSPTTGSISSDHLLQQVAATVDALQQGQLDAVIEYPQESGARSQAQLLFEFGKTVGEQRFHTVTTYQGDEGTQTSEQITIGETTWSRQGTGEWTKAPAQTSIHHQVQPFLPNISTITNPAIISDSQMTVIRWYDAARDADVTLTVDPATNAPQQMRQLTRATGAMLTVDYSGWNAAVDVKPPVAD